MANKRFVVKLSREERERLDKLIRKGKTSAKIILKARILLKADQGEAGERWSDEASPCCADPVDDYLTVTRTRRSGARGRPGRSSEGS